MTWSLGAREHKKIETRQRFRRAGLELYAEKGFEETTAEEIAARAGGSLRSFFRYFGCKEAVLFDEDGFEHLLHRVENPPSGEPLIKSLRQTIRKLDREEDMSFRLLRYELLGANPSIRSYLQQLTVDLHPKLVAAAEHRLGVDARKDPRPYAFALLFSTIASATVAEHPRNQRRFADDHLDAMRDLFTD